MVAILALLDIVAAVVMVSLMKEITADFGWGTREERWALMRRIMYALVAIALFAKGAYRVKHLEEQLEPLEFWSQIGLVGYIIMFPLLRAVGWISQDKLNGDLGKSKESHDRGRST